METMTGFYLGGAPKPFQTHFIKSNQDGYWSHEIKRWLLLGRKAVINLDSDIKKQRHHFANKSQSSQSYGFSSSHVRMGELDHKEGWEPKNWSFQIVVLEKTLESPLDCKEIKSVNPKGNRKVEVAQSCLTLCDPMEFSRPEYWREQPFPEINP